MDKEPLNSMPKYSLFGVGEQEYAKARVVVLPVPYDATASYRPGSRFGPMAIIQASRFIEPFSYELGFDISKLGIYTMDELMPNYSSPEAMIKEIAKEVGIIVDDGKVPLLLGGEHTIALGSLVALKERRIDLSVVQLDAHADLYDELNGTRYSHGSVMMRAKELYDDIFQVGIRSIDKKSFKKVDKKRVFFIEDVERMGAEELGKQINKMSKKNLYVTFDFDVLDPSEMPSTGTPEPHGMHFSEVIELFSALAAGKRLVGCDFVEFMPIQGITAPDYLAAKLIYLFLGNFLR